MEETGLLSLPEEVLINIGHFLDLKALLACSATCNYLRRVLNDNRLWRRHYRKDVVDYIKSATSLVPPAFLYDEGDSSNQLCQERVNLLRQTHLLANWREGRYISHKVQTLGDGLILENNDRQIIYENVYLFLHVLNTNEINIWNIEEIPYLYTSVKFTLYEYNMEYEDWPDIGKVLYQIVNDKLLVIQGNLVQVFSINLPNKELNIDYLISVDKDMTVNDFNDTLYTDCYSRIVGNRMISKLCYLPRVYIWDILTGTKIRSLRAPTVGWDLYVISTDDEDNVIFSLRTIDPFKDIAKITNHIYSYCVSKNEFTTLIAELKASKPVHSLRYMNYIVLFCTDDMFLFRRPNCTEVYVYDKNTSSVIAHGTFNDLVGLYKSKIVEDKLILATQSSVEILDVTSLQPIRVITFEDIIDIDYLPIFKTTFIITSSLKSDTEVWDIERDEILFKIPQQNYVFLNQSCSKLVMLSGQSLVVRHFW